MFQRLSQLVHISLAPHRDLLGPQFIRLKFVGFKFVSCRLEVLTWRHRCGQAKIVGVVASVSGAILMTCYKGPALFQLQSTAAGHSPETLHQLLVIRILSDLFGFVMDPWKLGALCLVGNCFCCASFINIQVIFKENSHFSTVIMPLYISILLWGYE